MANYVFKPTAEQALRSIQSAARRRLNTALGFSMRTLAIVLLSTLMALTLVACCSPSSEVGAERARSLSQADLQELYVFMERHKDQYMEWGNGGEPLPPNLERAGVLYGDVGHLDRLVFGGCVDDKASLSFEGLRGLGHRQIRLILGERKAEEILWRETEQSIL